MHLIFCIDDHDGLSFCGRRLSQDRILYDHILQRSAGRKLWMHPYSAKLFPDSTVLADADFLQKAECGDYCFVEITPITDLPAKPASVTLYHWNRSYPSTQKFPREILRGMQLSSTENFPGNSHEQITMEIYIP